ncbi:MAG TPA: NapC/NirT family cytochrome c [Vicinamibacterales bacterium]|nr:NapC/NirT family cytochrome c [Vicinamibacterales bacterium]
MPPKTLALRHPLALAGAVVSTTTAVLFLVVFLADLFGLHTNPYIGILFFLILPSLFVLGLLMIPAGAWLARRRVRAGRPPAALRWPSLDLNDPIQRHRAFLVLLITMANIVIVALATYRGIEYMDSVQFCGQVCHTVMQPEFSAYQDSPHSRVACVECHIGAGASWFARSKISGTRQVFAVAFHTYPRPIPTPVRNLRPARETCEECHWPEEFHGDKVVRVSEFASDEQNTETVTTLQVHVGGGSERLGIAQGIHWHMNVANEVEYIATDDKRQVIPYVRLRDRFGNVREYVAEGVTPDQLAKGERRRMDCIDCHNRPSHPIAASAEKAIDGAIAIGAIPRSLPFVRREAVQVVKGAYGSQQAASEAIEQALRGFYRKNYDDIYMKRRQDVERAVQATEAVYRRNVFPAMNVTFGTYPNNIGHIDFPGCFRCHDDNHKTKDGHVIKQDCDLCHAIS